MNFPIQITFRNVEASPAIEQWIEKQARKLSTFHERIIHCRVTVERAHRHLRRGNRFHVKVHVSVPGGQVTAGNISAPIDPEKLLEAGKKLKKQEMGVPQKDLRQAVVEAFRSTGRSLQDLVRRQRSEVKTHPMRQARVADLFADRGFGFLETPDGRRIYFHRNSVLHEGFGRLSPGMKVAFAEEAGEQGPQASTVRLVSPSRKHHRPSVAV